MYQLDPGFRIPALQRGLSPAEVVLTKVNAGVTSALLASAGVVSAPPMWAFGAVGAAAALINVAPGPRSIGRWATVGYRHLRERTVPDSLIPRTGCTRTWTLYPDHGTMQDPNYRASFHDTFSRALTFAAGKARRAGIQVHVTHHATGGDYTHHTQTISVHIPKALMPHPERVMDTLEGEFSALGYLTRVELEPVPAIVERDPGWVAFDDGRYATTARITGWPADDEGDLMPKLLLREGAGKARDTAHDRSLAVLYRPLPPAQSRRSAKWQRVTSEVVTKDQVKLDANELSSGAMHGALVQGDALVDVDAYVTVWGDSPEAVTEARWATTTTADRYRMRLDWLTGQQHRAHVMTTAHGASTRKGAIL
ncbi:hypothetical protein [Streptomyces sp. NPDC050738]|uniref:hypothetical protein n=1 Tax=Streptomyces sp. NPDC050738 TaxID=3154744 RepID=UPI0034377513